MVNMKYNKRIKPSLSLLSILCAATMSVHAAERPAGLSDEDIAYVKQLINNEMQAQDDAKAKQELDNGFEFNGYFRSGTNTILGSGSKNNGSCYSLNYPKNDGVYYRLGNECRDYSEFQQSKKQQLNGVNFKAVFMMDFAGDSRDPTATEEWSRRSRQLYVTR